MATTLLLSVRFHEGRYHGVPDWPPAPARLFQALVAGAAQGALLDGEAQACLRWLEGLDPPVIAAPYQRRGVSLTVFVPNNDLDTKGGDPGRVAEIRAGKPVRARLFDAAVPLLYLWSVPEGGEDRARAVAALAGRLYQLGRGVDMAWAAADLLPTAEAEARLAAHPGSVHRPGGWEGTRLACPVPGTLASLIDRFDKRGKRFGPLLADKPTKRDPQRRIRVGTVFRQPPKPVVRQVHYDAPATLLAFDLRREDGRLAALPPDRAGELVTRVRDGLARRLESGLDPGLIRRLVIGEGADAADKAARIRIVPIPSIGSPLVTQAIRRLVIVVPALCPIDAQEVDWAASGIAPADPQTGEITGAWQLVPAQDRKMLGHYGLEGAEAEASLLWRSVTALALPAAPRRRLDPDRLASADTAIRAGETKAGGERLAEEAAALKAVRHACRHAEIDPARIAGIRVRREPWSPRGARAEAFADGTRFDKHRLWHVEIRFTRPPPAPLLLGDGRWLGLGLMAPVVGRAAAVTADTRPDMQDGMAWFGPGPGGSWPRVEDRSLLLHHVRRALMSLAAEPDGTVPPLFSGHETGPDPARPGHHAHVFLAAVDEDGDGRIDRVGIIAPWRADRTMPRRLRTPDRFARVVARLGEVIAGPLGVLSLAPIEAPPAFGDRPSAWWSTVTRYRPTRHPKDRAGGVDQVAGDIALECRRRGLPRPIRVTPTMHWGPRDGVWVDAVIAFARPVPGPILLGRDSHRGQGLFVPAEPG